jgi:hypothetical protein
MRFAMPHLPCTFEIPDDWLSEAGWVGFQPSVAAYRSTKATLFAPLTQIEPIARLNSVPKDFCGFDRARFVRALKGFVDDDDIEPVDAEEMPIFEFCHSPFRYRLCDGFHRFHAAVAAGFAALPLKV